MSRRPHHQGSVLLLGVSLAAAFLTPASPAKAGILVGIGGKCADIEVVATADGTPVNLFECNGGENQRWEFESIAPFFRVRGIAGKCLQPEGGENSRLVIGPCGGLEERWQPGPEFPNGFTLVHVTTGQCMDVEAAGTANGTPINLFSCHGDLNQRWTFEQEDEPQPPPPGSLVGIDDKCADVEAAATADGTPVNLFACHGGENQLWEFESVAPFFRVRGLAGKCLQPEGGENSHLVIGPCGGLEDRWQPDANFPNGFTLVHVTTGLCMDVEDSGTADGTPINLFQCHGGLNQQWTWAQEAEEPPGVCSPQPTNFCLNGGRFRVEVEWRDFAGATGVGQVLPFASDDSGLFWFFTADNWEMLVKVLDGCDLNDHFWVFAAATTDVEYTLTVTDTETSVVRQYFNPLGTAAMAVTDTGAFATCP